MKLSHVADWGGGRGNCVVGTAGRLRHEGIAARGAVSATGSHARHGRSHVKKNLDSSIFGEATPRSCLARRDPGTPGDAALARREAGAQRIGSTAVPPRPGSEPVKH